MARRMASACQRNIQMGTDTMMAIHRPWRTVRRTSRTEWRRRPSSVAIIGETASIRPSPKIIGRKYRLEPSEPAARALGPSRPIMSTSVAVMAVWPRLVRIIGQLRASIARISPRHGFSDARAAVTTAVMVLSFGARSRPHAWPDIAGLVPGHARNRSCAVLLNEFSRRGKMSQ
jgi:hypothetical protein